MSKVGCPAAADVFSAQGGRPRRPPIAPSGAVRTRVRLHVQQTPLAVIEWDVAGAITHWNPGAVRISATPDKRFLIVPSPAWFRRKSRERAKRVWSALLARKGGQRSTNENVTKDGRTILCDWYSTPLVNAEGQVIGVASLAEDITERKQAEEVVQKARDGLERRVEERTAELRQANELLHAEVEHRRQMEEALRASEQRRQIGAGSQPISCAGVGCRHRSCVAFRSLLPRPGINRKTVRLWDAGRSRDQRGLP